MKDKDTKQKKKKSKVVYYEDTGDTVYSMAALHGRTPEEQEAFDEQRKRYVSFNWREKRAMIAAAFTVYGPLLLCMVGAFLLAAFLLYLFLL